MAHLTHTIENGLAVIVLDNPPENRLSSQMFSELSSALSVIGSSEARALLMRAEGENFSLGGDIVPWPEMSSRELRSLLETYMVCVNQFERLSIPTVAAVQGRCFGGGFELALRADVNICRRNGTLRSYRTVAWTRNRPRRPLSSCRTGRSIKGNRMGTDFRAHSLARDGTLRRRQQRGSRR